MSQVPECFSLTSSTAPAKATVSLPGDVDQLTWDVLERVLASLAAESPPNQATEAVGS